MKFFLCRIALFLFAAAPVSAQNPLWENIVGTYTHRVYSDPAWTPFSYTESYLTDSMTVETVEVRFCSFGPRTLLCTSTLEISIDSSAQSLMVRVDSLPTHVLTGWGYLDAYQGTGILRGDTLVATFRNKVSEPSPFFFYYRQDTLPDTSCDPQTLIQTSLLENPFERKYWLDPNGGYPWIRYLIEGQEPIVFEKKWEEEARE